MRERDTSLSVRRGRSWPGAGMGDAQRCPVPGSRARRAPTHHSDGVVQQRLPEDDYEQDLVDVHLLEHGQDGHRVHGGDQAAKQEEVQQSDVQVPCETAAPSARALRGLE